MYIEGSTTPSICHGGTRIRTQMQPTNFIRCPKKTIDGVSPEAQHRRQVGGSQRESRGLTLEGSGALELNRWRERGSQ